MDASKVNQLYSMLKSADAREYLFTMETGGTGGDSQKNQCGIA